MTRLVTTTAAIAFCLMAHATGTSAEQGSAGPTAASAQAAATPSDCKPAAPPPGPRRPLPPRPVDMSPRVGMHCAPVVNLHLAPGGTLVDCEKQAQPCRPATAGVVPPAGPPVAGSMPTPAQVDRTLERWTEGRLKIGSLIEASFKSKDQIFIYTALGIATVFLAVYFGAMYFRNRSAPRGQEPAATGPVLVALVLSIVTGILIWHFWPGARTTESVHVQVEEILKQQLPVATVTTVAPAPPPVIVQAPPPPEPAPRGGAATDAAAHQISFVVLAALLGLLTGLTMPIALRDGRRNRFGEPAPRPMPIYDGPQPPIASTIDSPATLAAVYEVEDALTALRQATSPASAKEPPPALPIGPLVQALDLLRWQLEAGDAAERTSLQERTSRLAGLRATAGARSEVGHILSQLDARLQDRYRTPATVWRHQALHEVRMARRRLIELAQIDA